MKTKALGVVTLGASFLLVTACSGGAFTTLEDEPERPGGEDAAVEAGPLVDGGKDASADAGGDADASIEGGSIDADADAGDAGSDADVEDAPLGDADPDDADSGDGGVDAGETDAADASDGDDDACTMITWYRDDDGDGVGGPVSFEGCEPPSEGAWVTKGGDCHDDNADVYPGQTEFFTVPYAVANEPGAMSFDYDCSGKEIADTSEKSDGTCSLFGGLCSGKGYLVVEPVRTGEGVDPYCGSNTYFTCALLQGCSGTKSTKPKVGCR